MDLTRTRRARRKVDAIFERLHVRPMGLLVFLGSATLLAILHAGGTGSVRAPAVASAVGTEHPSPAATVVEATHVAPGDRVEAGAPLVTLSPRFLERELALIDAEAERLIARARFERAQVEQGDLERATELELTVARARRDQQRAIALGAREEALAQAAQRQLDQVAAQVKSGVTPVDELLQAEWTAEAQRSGTSEARAAAQAEQALLARLQKSLGVSSGSRLTDPLERANQAELELLLRRRRDVTDDLRALTVKARASGIVRSVLPVGASVALDVSVATVVPELATEVVAYVPPDQSVAALGPGARARLTGGDCSGPSRVLRRGAAVEEAPGQLTTAFRTPVFGTPLHLTIPRSCALAVGQVVSVELTPPAGGR